MQKQYVTPLLIVKHRLARETRDFLLQLYAELSCEIEAKVSSRHCMACHTDSEAL